MTLSVNDKGNVISGTNSLEGCTMTAKKETNSVDMLKLFVENDDLVWYSFNDSQPICSKLTSEKFVESKLFKRSECFRLPASRSTSYLINRLWVKRKIGDAISLQLCSSRPLIKCDNKYKLDTVSKFLYIHNYVDTPSRGGWHEFTDDEYPTYLISELLKEKNTLAKNYNSRLMYIYEQHPLNQPMSFFREFDQLRIGEILGLVMDPRFFINPSDPDKDYDLMSFLGVFHSIIRKNIIDPNITSRASRLATLISIWKTDSFLNMKKLSPGVEFIRNSWLRIKALHKDPYAADLIITRYVISFIRNYWLNTLYATKNAWAEPLFLTDDYFSGDSVLINKFKKHIASNRK